MRHEAIHHHRGDLSVNLVALLMLSLHWFNPVAHRAWRAFRADQELACDAVVLEGASGEERHSYALALVKSACARTPVAACSLNPRDQLKRRLRMMKAAGQRHASGRALAAALVGAGLVLTASGGIAAETSQDIRREVTIRVIAPAARAVGIAPPAPEAPVAPLAPPARRAPPAPVAPAAPDAESANWPAEQEKEAREAIRESGAARQEALKAAAEARREAAEAMREREAIPHAEALARHGMAVWADDDADQFSFSMALPGTCGGKADSGEVSMSMSGKAGKIRNRTVRICGPVMSEAQVRRITIEALQRARTSLAGSGELSAAQRDKALSAIDAEIERLAREL